MNKALTPITYDQDFYAWLLMSAQLLRERRFPELDVENLAEELEGMARSDRRQLVNRFAVLLAHLLKWQFEPERRSKSWKGTIKEQRKRIELLLKDSPSLKYDIDDKIHDAYELAIIMASNETGLNEQIFPQTCEYSFKEILDNKFFPG